MKRKPLLLAVEVASPVVLVALWWAVTALAVPALSPERALFFPPPDRIAVAFYGAFVGPGFFEIVGPTLRRFFIGYTLSVVLGVAIGLAVGGRRRWRRALDPVFGFFRSVPGAALIPIMSAFLGLGDAQKVALIVMAALWPILVNTVDGVRAIDPTLLDTVRAYQIRGWDRLWRVTLPAALPQAVAGMRVAVAVALIVTIISELIGSSTGLGAFFVDAQSGFDLPNVWAGLLLLGLLGYALNLLFILFERWALAWHEGSRGVGDGV